jgi:excisionase family DNA binding protein
MLKRDTATPSEEAQQLRRQITENDPIYDVTDVAHVLGIEQSSVLRHIRNGDLVATKLGKNYRIRKSELTAFRERVEAEAAEEARRTRIRRDVARRMEEYKAKPATAKAWTAIQCDNCGETALLRVIQELDRTSSLYRRGEYAWRGKCDMCGENFNLPTDESDLKSFATQEEEAAAAAAIARRMATAQAEADDVVMTLRVNRPEQCWHVADCEACDCRASAAAKIVAKDDRYVTDGLCYYCRARYERTLAPSTEGKTIEDLAIGNESVYWKNARIPL